MTIKETIKKINSIASEVEKIEKKLDKEGKQIQDLPLEEQKQIRELQMQAQRLQKTVIKTTMSEFLDRLAKYWYVARENMKVKVRFSKKSVGPGRVISKERFFKEYNYKGEMRIEIEGENRHIEFYRDFNPDLVQADGRTLGESVWIKTGKSVGFDLMYPILDNLDNFVFESYLYQLCECEENGKMTPRQGYRKIILKMALEKEKQAEKENGISC